MRPLVKRVIQFRAQGFAEIMLIVTKWLLLEDEAGQLWWTMLRQGAFCPTDDPCTQLWAVLDHMVGPQRCCQQP